MEKTKSLCEICSPKQWKTISADMLTDEGYPVYGANGVIGFYSEYNHKEPTLLITCRGATCGALNICEPYSYVNGNAMALDNLTDEVDIKYLYYFLFNRGFADVITGSAQPQIVRQSLQKISVTYPDLEKQEETVTTLEKISALITMRKEQLAKLDELVKARFVEMFGDPVVNPFNWTTTSIGCLIESCDSGWSGNGTQRTRQPGEIAVLKVSAVTKGYFIPDECKVLDEQHNIKKYVFPQKGDLLFSRANTREMVGATAVINEDYPELILPDKLWKIRFKNLANVLYMKHILSHKSIRTKFSEASTGTSGSMYNVSMDKFKSIVIPVPPVQLQEQFASFVEQTNKSKLTIQSSLDKLEVMKKALMQEYFG